CERHRRARALASARRTNVVSAAAIRFPLAGVRHARAPAEAPDGLNYQGEPMKTTVVSDRLIQLNRLRFVNAYLVREDDGFTLVDTTVSGGAEDLIAAAQSAGDQIRRIALTHGHGDHIGSLDALKQSLGDSVE